MTEVYPEQDFDREPSTADRKVGAAAIEAAKQLTAAALSKPVEEVTLTDLITEFSRAGFSEWPADVARGTRDILATEHGYSHI